MSSTATPTSRPLVLHPFLFGLFYPELAAVNLFRTLFDTYLETSYGTLEDATWITPQQGGVLMKVTEVH